MIVADLSNNRRITRLTQLNHELQTSHEPMQTFEALLQAFFDVSGFVASMLISTAGLPSGYYRVLRADFENRPLGVGAQSHLDGAAVRRGGIVAQIMARPEPQLIQDVDWTVDPYLYKPLEGYSSVMAIPLAGEHLPMSWALLLATPPQRFTEKDLEEAVERATLIGALLENQLLAEELTRAHAWIDADAKQLGDLQRALLPPSPPRIAGLDIATSYQTSGRAGGDLYDFFPLDPPPGDATATNRHAQRWCVLIGDAAGHGLAAAVMVAIVQAVLRAHPPRMDSPASLLTHANRQLCEKRIGGFFTGFLGIYEPAARRLTYANAGHPAPLLRRPSENLIRPLDAVLSYPLGIDEDECFQEAIVQLAPGDTVLFYTDGITEARNRDEERFECERVTQILQAADDRPADLIDRLCATVRTHESGRSPLDDQTLVAARAL